MTSTPPTISEGTREQYARRARQLHVLVGRLRGKVQCELLPMDVVDFVVARMEVDPACPDAPQGNARRKTPSPIRTAKKKRGDAAVKDPYAVISKATFRVQKAALLWYFREASENAETRLDREYLQAAIHRLESISQTNYAKRGSHTSALKQKKFPDDDFRAVMDALEGSTRQNHNCLRTFLLANRLVGLRPSEWKTASVHRASPGSDEMVLTVHNAKNTNSRGNGKTRTLLLKDLGNDDLDALHEMVQLVEAVDSGLMVDGRGRTSTFKPWIRCLASSLAEITATVFPRRTLRPTMYSLRHQVMADAKWSGESQAEVAALAGHATEDTAGRHYARGVSGARQQRVKASPSNVATVRPGRPRGPKPVF